MSLDTDTFKALDKQYDACVERGIKAEKKRKGKKDLSKEELAEIEKKCKADFNAYTTWVSRFDWGGKNKRARSIKSRKNKRRSSKRSQSNKMRRSKSKKSIYF
jgi:hypothetical protein